MRKVIHLDTLKGLPGRYLKQLQRHNHLFASNSYLDDLLEEEQELMDIVMDMDDYCSTNYIKGYHYTRAVESEIVEHGLLSRSGEEIRNVFLDKYGDRFSIPELMIIKEMWDKYFGERQKKSRDYRIFFNTTKVALGNGGADALLEHFGGEQIHMALNDHEEVQRKLSQIGVPLMVSFLILGAEAKGIGQQYPWGMVALSTYHRMINPEAFMHDVDAYVSNNIPPKNIVEIKCL